MSAALQPGRLATLEETQAVTKQLKDYPEYWLGQIKIITEQERRNVLTKAEMVKEVRRVMRELAQWEAGKGPHHIARVSP